MNGIFVILHRRGHSNNTLRVKRGYGTVSPNITRVREGSFKVSRDIFSRKNWLDCYFSLLENKVFRKIKVLAVEKHCKLLGSSYFCHSF